MEIAINTTVTFNFANERRATLEARELAEFRRALVQTRGRPGEKPEDGMLLDWDILEAETVAYVKEKAGIDITKAEARGVFDNASAAWEEVQKKFKPRIVASAISPDSTDARYSD